ncbi:MAG TPA: DUF3159 domain-containing protein [Dermatophilaceae bacterium]|nr:DUF3159 domain-containing protein [Dermatophilaceae bacterium]
MSGPAAEPEAQTVEEVIRHRLSAALGGWRGSLETALPTVAFVVGWTATQDVRPSVLAAAAVLGVLLVVRVASRQTPRYVLTSVLATAVAAFFALRSGRAEDAFLPGILTSLAWMVGSLLSVVVRWPLVGFLVGVGDPRFAEDPTAWQRDRGLVSVCSRLTLVLVGLYAVRVAVMLPLYFAGQVAALGISKILLGWPAYVGAVAVMGWMLLRGRTPVAS